MVPVWMTLSDLVPYILESSLRSDIKSWLWRMAVKIGLYITGSTTNISWKNEVGNKEVTLPKMENLDLIINERRLRWLGIVLCMDDSRLSSRIVLEVKQKPWRQRINLIDTIRQDLKGIGITRNKVNNLLSTEKNNFECSLVFSTRDAVRLTVRIRLRLSNPQKAHRCPEMCAGALAVWR